MLCFLELAGCAASILQGRGGKSPRLVWLDMACKLRIVAVGTVVIGAPVAVVMVSPVLAGVLKGVVEVDIEAEVRPISGSGDAGHGVRLGD